MTSSFEWSDVAALLRDAPPAHLATSSVDGGPHVSVVMPGVDGHVLWLVTWRRSAKATNLAADPRVALMWSANSAETYVWGSAEPVDDAELRRRLWVGSVLPYDPEGFFGPVESGESIVFRITPTRAVAKLGGEGGPRTLRWGADPG